MYYEKEAMTNAENQAIKTLAMEEPNRVMARHTFLKRVMTITGCSAIGLLLDACGSSTATAPTNAAAPTTAASTAAATAEPAATAATSAASAAATVTPAPTNGAATSTTATAGGPGGAAPAGGAGGGPGGNNESAALAEAFKGVTTEVAKTHHYWTEHRNVSYA
jgi:hypothetical protein